jgi:hypothetical protein
VIGVTFFLKNLKIHDLLNFQEKNHPETGVDEDEPADLI